MQCCFGHQSRSDTLGLVCLHWLLIRIRDRTLLESAWRRCFFSFYGFARCSANWTRKRWGFKVCLLIWCFNCRLHLWLVRSFFHDECSQLSWAICSWSTQSVNSFHSTAVYCHQVWLAYGSFADYGLIELYWSKMTWQLALFQAYHPSSSPSCTL